MPEVRHVLVDLGQPLPHPVVDIITINDNPGHDDHEELHVAEPFKALVSDDAQLGWTWTEEGGLKAPLS